MNFLEELMLGDLNLIPSFPEFSKIDTGENLIHTGPLLYEGQRNKVNFKAIREAIKVFVYMGNFPDPGWHKVRNYLQTQLMNKDIGFVWATGNQEDKSQNNPPIYWQGYVSGSSAIEGCDLYLNHGGHSSCMRAMAKGTKSIVIPTNSERLWNGRQCEVLKVGKVFPLSELYGLTETFIKEYCKSKTDTVNLSKYESVRQDAVNRIIRLI